MSVLIFADIPRLIGQSLRKSLEASDLRRAQHPRAKVVASPGTATREQAVMSRLLQIFWSGIISVIAAVLTTVIDWTVLEWRTFCLSVCIAAFLALLTFLGRLFNDVSGPRALNR